MKLKFYFIGLGMGIIVTAIIMEIALASKSRPMSDEEVIVRAKQLGMVEASSRLSNITQSVSSGDNQNSSVSQENAEASSVSAGSSLNNAAVVERGDKEGEEIVMQDTVSQYTSKQDAQTGISAASAGTSSVKTYSSGGYGSSNGTASKPDSSENKSASGESSSSASGSGKSTVNGGSIIVTIQDGWYSEEVSSFLESAGVVDDAVAFNTYLVQSGRDKYISPGAKLVPRGATYEDVAKVISGC